MTQSESDGEGLRSRAEVDPISIKGSDSSALSVKQVIENFSLMGRFAPEFQPILGGYSLCETGEVFRNNQGHLMAKE